jgi:PKHD-type hydroxylase
MWNDYFNPDMCRDIVKRALNIKPVEATTFGNVANLRRSKVRWISRSNFDWSRLFFDVENICRRANVAFGFNLNMFYEIQFTEYNSEANGFYGWHEDLLWVPPEGKNSQRKLSFVMQLTDPSEYEGGSLEFQIPGQELPNPSILKKQGTAVVFPSFIKHRVTPVTKGVRYSLVTWYEGPPFQ